MPRRRKLARLRSKTIRKAFSKDYRIHGLEPRLLFTTLSAGPGVIGQFEYEAEGGGVMRIVYSDVTFEAIGVSVDPKTDAMAIGDLVPGGLKAPVAPLLPFNLFTIYVQTSAPIRSSPWHLYRASPILRRWEYALIIRLERGNHCWSIPLTAWGCLTMLLPVEELVLVCSARLRSR